MIYGDKCINLVDEHHIKTMVLLPALFLKLTGCEDHIYSALSRPRDDGSHKIGVKSIPYDQCNNFPSNREKGNALVIIRICPFTLTFIEVDNVGTLEILWHCLLLDFLFIFGKFISVILSFHEGMMARVVEISDPFLVTSGTKHCCVLASTVFSILLLAMLMDAFHDTDRGVCTQLCSVISCSIFNASVLA